MRPPLPRRRLIPRWRPVSKTLETSEVESILGKKTSKLTFDRALFHDAVQDWRNTPTAGHLGDVVAFSADEELKPQIASIVKEAAEKGHAISEAQKSIFADLHEEVADPDDTKIEGQLAVQARVAQLRRELLVAPDNVLALLDLAQLQLAAGKQEAAKRLLFTALNLAPNGRIVLRTAARFFVHLDESDRAHSLIARHPATKEDPWLMASEIALADAAGRSSSLLNAARRLIRSATRPPRQLAELAGAVANRELMEGSVKDARGFLRLALEQPTDNVIAQAMIDARILGVRLEEPVVERALHRSAEAQLFQAWIAADEQRAEAHAMVWHSEEPFSSRPLQFLTALYGVRGEYTKALEWVQKGLIADPTDSGLITNLVFVQAAVGEIEQAESGIRRARASVMAEKEPFFKATEGLIALQRGDFEKGKAFYRDAEQLFAKRGDLTGAALSVAYYASFAKRYGAPDAGALIVEAAEKVKKSPSTDGLILLAKLSHKAVEAPPDDEQQRRLSQWIFDPSTNTLTQRVGVTAKGAPGLIVQPSKTPKQD